MSEMALRGTCPVPSGAITWYGDPVLTTGAYRGWTTLKSVVPKASLRVFQPLSAFSDDERARWERYLVEGRHLHQAAVLYRQILVASKLGMLAPREVEHADVRLVEGEYHVCPWRTRIRILSSLLSLRESTAPEVAEQLVPDAEARRVARELAKLRRKDPSAVPFILEATWHVPLRWFALFIDDEREVVRGEGRGGTIRYRTTVGRARRRLDYALTVVRKVDLEPLEEALTGMSRWLAAFDRRSIAELDYGDLGTMMGWAELEDDHSARDINEAIEALNRRETSHSADLYQQVAGRWAEIRAQESLN